jgi:arginase
MKKYPGFLLTAFVVITAVVYPQDYRGDGAVRVAITRNPFGAAPSIMAEGLTESLVRLGCRIARSETFVLSDRELEYRGWARSALTGRRIGNLISAYGKGEFLTVALLGSCADLPGVLAGLQNMGPGKGEQTYHLAARVPHRVGLIYFDAHADINIPETTLSGMYGGMDVALAAGLFNRGNRLIHGLDPPLPPAYIVLGDVRDTDPRETELINRLGIQSLSTDDIRRRTDHVRFQMDRLSALTDMIYIHVDMDVLAPEEVRGHGLTAPDGPTSRELAACIELIFTWPKAAAIGIASTPYGERDPEHISRRAAIRLIEGAISGVQKRR